MVAGICGIRKHLTGTPEARTAPPRGASFAAF